MSWQYETEYASANVCTCRCVGDNSVCACVRTWCSVRASEGTGIAAVRRAWVSQQMRTFEELGCE